ncbi:guanylate-binding protein 2-like [Polyodon spathula]|uniref:guanylate-binding protein 2-like n=1 Tax=Polyodon spathula TaxID=7913 RepID=UPI001B7EF67F|nr:guanylate-binding protein 2-like [Polyodon spathula]XP_041091430.1 guanylate-binding protein 2-like [Polyodon spathula]XP_041091431.1 guanylate-binding protein 2-like [Polyodon spathula]XP_041091432.1 guanylate-binding protein 2-like [Polyodon spathula]
MDAPQQLVKFTSDRLVINEEVAKYLSTLMGVAEVISIVGKSRTGKSYLLSRFFGDGNGFKVEHDYKACTKGIWVWARPHPSRPDTNLLLLDTEGADDFKGGVLQDKQIFLLTSLLSSSLIYNTMKSLNKSDTTDIIELLQAVREILTLDKSQEGSSGSLQDYLPNHFYFVIRDCQFEDCGEEEFLQYVLNSMDTCMKENIKAAFSNMEMQLLPAPMRSLKELKPEDLDTKFQTALSEFITRVRDKRSTPKTVSKEKTHCTPGGIVDLARSYVRKLNNNESVCLREAAKDMTETQLNRAFREAWEEFQSYMQAVIDQLPMETKQLTEAHSEAQQRAMTAYEKYTSFCIDVQKTQDKKCAFSVQIENNREVLLKINYEKSELKCGKEFAILKKKHIGPVTDYTGIEAFEKMRRQINKLIDGYNQLSGMGPAKQAVFSELYKTELVDLLTIAYKATISFIEQQYAERKGRIQLFVAELKKTADIMDKLQKDSTIANVAGSSTAVAGSILTITGLALLPFTFGASAILTGVGVGVGVAGGVTTVTADICRFVKNKDLNNDVKAAHEKIVQDLKEIAELLEYVCGQLSEEKEVGDINWMNHVYRIFAIGNFVGVLDDIVAVGARVAANVARVAGIVLAALVIVLDSFAIIKKSIKIHEGCKTERAKEIRDLAQSIEEELTKVEGCIAQMKNTKKSYDETSLMIQTTQLSLFAKKNTKKSYDETSLMIQTTQLSLCQKKKTKKNHSDLKMSSR